MADKKKKEDGANASATERRKIINARLKALGIKPNCAKVGEDEYTPTEFLPTGISELDVILGEGQGIPYGTVLELAGESQSGKTHIALCLIAQAQSKGERCAFLNVENSFYPPRAKQIGVSLDPNLFELYENVGSAEKYGELLKLLISTGEYRVIVVDSISAMIPEDEMQKSLEDKQTLGLHARFVKRMVKQILSPCDETGTLAVLINQLYMGSGKMPNSMELQGSGGNAMNYMPHMRLWFSKVLGKAGQILDKDQNIIGGKSRVLVQKTRYGQPLVKSDFPIMFVQAEADPVAEFLYRAQAKGFDYIKYAYKKYKYVNPDTGEVVESKDTGAFILLLAQHPAPEKRTRGDNSTTAFEYICGRLKLDANKQAMILAKAEAGEIAGANTDADGFEEVDMDDEDDE